MTLAAEELEFLARRSIEPVGEGWRFRWDRRALDTEPVDPFAFLADVRCIARVMAGSESEVMPPASAERFAIAILGAVLEFVAGVGHHVELEACGVKKFDSGRDGVLVIPVEPVQTARRADVCSVSAPLLGCRRARPRRW